MTIIEKKKMRLKYFYYIDTEKILKSIQDSSAYQNIATNNNKENLFHLIFSYIASASERYSSFILGAPGLPIHSFFSDNNSNISIKNSYYLAGISLFNHCLMHGFYQELEQSKLSPALKSAYGTQAETINLSQATEKDIRAGYLYSTTEKFIPPTADPYEKSAQNYNNYYARFGENKNRFTYKFLAHLMGTEEINTPPKINKLQSTGALFMFLDHDVKIFDNILSTSSKNHIKTLRQYAKIYCNTTQWKDKLQYYPDRVLFDNVIEHAYDFDFNAYAYDLLKNELKKTPTNTPSIRDLFGAQFTNILSMYASTLPMTYNKSIFLKCALKILESADTIAPTFPPSPSPHAGMYMSFVPETQTTFSSKALTQLTNYYLTLHYLTIPVLEDLWDVLTVELEPRISLQDYCEFIEKYYNVISYDYTLLPESPLTSGPSIATYQSIFTAIYEYLNNNPPTHYSPYEFEANETGKKEHFSYKHLLLDYFVPLLDRCSILSYHHPDNDHLAQQLCLSPDACRELKPYHLETQTYQFRHTNNLFEFIIQPNKLYFTPPCPMEKSCSTGE